MEELDILRLGRKSVHAVLVLISRQFVLQMISTATFLLISSVLLPGDIGMYTAVIAMQRIISFFTDFGLGAALIQKKEELTQKDMETSFTIQATITLMLFILIFLLRDIISSYFKLSPSGQGLLLALVFTIFISSFKTIPSILLERKIQFQKLVIPQITESLVFNIVLIIMVLQGFRIDSYTYAFLISGIASLPIYYRISPWKIGLGIDKKSLTYLKFGLQFQAKNILATIKDDLLTVILTKFLTFAQIGYIGFAQRIAFLTYRYIVDSVTKVTFASYARVQSDKHILKKAIEKSLFYVSSVMFPLIAGTIIIAPFLIKYFPRWQNKWEPAIISIIFFSLNAAVSSLSGILVNALDATGRVKTTLNLMVIWTILTWILTPLFIIWFGFNGVAIASFIVTTTIVYTIYLVKKVVDFNFFSCVQKPLSATLVMFLIIFVFTKIIPDNILMIPLIILFGVLIYTALFYILAKDELFAIKNIILKKYE
jgi:O-antigen/teichoic acid export membrane protein